MPAHRAARRTRRARAAALGGLTLIGVFGPGAGMALAASPGDENCGDFEYQEDAQDVYDADTSDPNHLDGNDQDGVVCESLPHRGATSPITDVGLTDQEADAPTSGSSGATATAGPSHRTSSPRASVTRDRDCADFSSRAAAQAVLDDDPSDPERLDADDDGLACESFAYGDRGDRVDDVDVRPAAARSTGPTDQPSAYPVGGVEAGDGSAPSDGLGVLGYGLLGTAAVAGAVAAHHVRPGRHRRA